MAFVLQPWQLLVLIVSASMTKLQQEVIQYLMTENQVLKEKLGPGRKLLSGHGTSRVNVPKLSVTRAVGRPVGSI